MSIADRLFIARLREREEDAFSEMVRLEGDRVFNLVYRMVGDRSEAEDIAQEVFVTVFKQIDSFRGESQFSTWLLRIAANHAKNRIKYLARRRTTDDDVNEMETDHDPSLADRSMQARIHRPDTILEVAELGDLLERAIAALDEEQRLLVVLRDMEELSYEDICEITGLPEGTVKSRLHRARMELKALLDKNTR
ncbi:MAG: sigma-70 family RNA polymerase sigma factor [Deltaproteobacteria bacterium]|nr:sigma-70 family RNA polymerase sigma factor [Deltaproteobacteria bacterium]